jgi:hypothetical protein
MRHRVLLVPLVAAASFLAACTGHSQQSASRASGSVASAPTGASSVPASAGQSSLSAASNGCAGQPPISSLPTWARAGFTPPDVAMPHVTGASGNIVAVLWSPKNALHAPPLPNMGNKILWVSRVPMDGPAPLVIRATLAGSTRTATVSLPDGPGPSYVNLPAPGCWTLHLSLGGHTDRLMLRYVS